MKLDRKIGMKHVLSYGGRCFTIIRYQLPKLIWHFETGSTSLSKM